MSDPVRINGYVADGGSITCKVDGVEYFGFTEISGYKDAIEEKLIYGHNRDRGPRARTAGIKKPEKVTVIGPRSTCHELRLALLQKAKKDAKGKRKVSGATCEFTVSFVENSYPHVDLLEGMRLLSIDTKIPAAESSDAILETMEFQPMSIKRTGLDL
jgi:hypothetical protein